MTQVELGQHLPGYRFTTREWIWWPLLVQEMMFGSYRCKCVAKQFSDAHLAFVAFQFFIHNVSHIFQVRGQLENETWSNIGVVWKPNTVNADDNVEGGLTVRRHLSQHYLTP